MELKVGERITVEAESTERPTRNGVIEEVVSEQPVPRYRIRWDDGHESIVLPPRPARSGPRSRERRPNLGKLLGG